MLSALGSRGITRIALSNTPLPELIETLMRMALILLLDRIQGGGDWPKSEALMRLLEEVPFLSMNASFFGDGKGDLAAARQNGVPFVASIPVLASLPPKQALSVHTGILWSGLRKL